MKPSTCCNRAYLATGDYRECDCSRKASVHALLGLWDAIVSAWPLYALLVIWSVLAWAMTA